MEQVDPLIDYLKQLVDEPDRRVNRWVGWWAGIMFNIIVKAIKTISTVSPDEIASLACQCGSISGFYANHGDTLHGSLAY